MDLKDQSIRRQRNSYPSKSISKENRRTQRKGKQEDGKQRLHLLPRGKWIFKT